MKKQITIYHGSSRVVEAPVFGDGRQNNDFGLGFYCTEAQRPAPKVFTVTARG